jgi:hypothetical protein
MSALNFDDVRRSMSEIRVSLKRDIERIRANTNYSDRGIAREIAKSLLSHRAQAQQLRDNYQSNNEATRVKLTARLFGVPAGADATTVLSYRDGADRAEKLTSAKEAQTMLTRAVERGDALLARAIAGHAHTSGWDDVTESYAEATGMRDALGELGGLASGRETRLGEAALFAVFAPTEVRKYVPSDSDEELRRFVKDDGTRAPQATGVGSPIDLTGPR